MSNDLILFVKNQLLARNWSERDLASRSELSPQAVNMFLKGDRDIRQSTILALSKALGVPAFYLLMTPEERTKWDQAQMPSSEPEAQIEKESKMITSAIEALNARVRELEEKSGKIQPSASGQQTESFKK
jgi:transcriptional regulator with XRE-family HTH domain